MQASITDAMKVLACTDDKQDIRATISDIGSQMEGQSVSVRNLNYELPYSDWLYELVMARLIPLGFTVTHQYSGKPLAIANEYILSRSGLMVYHAVKCEKRVQALYVTVNTDVLQCHYDI